MTYSILFSANKVTVMPSVQQRSDESSLMLFFLLEIGRLLLNIIYITDMHTAKK
jgi:hypothetical protein